MKQDDFYAALMAPQLPAPHALRALRAPGDRPAGRRFNIYRNNVAAGLSEALAAKYPAIQRLVGDEFFSALAGEFIRTHPARSPILSEFGEEFADFLMHFPPLESYPYMGDVARLEAAWLNAYHAADAPILRAEKLASLPTETFADLRLTIHPATHLIASAYPVLDIFMANRNDSGNIQADLRQGPQSVLVTRPGLSVLTTELSRQDFACLNAIIDGLPLARAAQMAADLSEKFDLTGFLEQIFKAGALRDLPD